MLPLHDTSAMSPPALVRAHRGGTSAHRHLAAGDRHEAREAGLGGEEVVVGRIQPSRSRPGSRWRAEAAGLVVEEAGVHLAPTAAHRGQRTDPGEEKRCGGRALGRCPRSPRTRRSRPRGVAPAGARARRSPPGAARPAGGTTRASPTLRRRGAAAIAASVAPGRIGSARRPRRVACERARPRRRPSPPAPASESPVVIGAGHGRRTPLLRHREQRLPQGDGGCSCRCTPWRRRRSNTSSGEVVPVVEVPR